MPASKVLPRPWRRFAHASSPLGVALVLCFATANPVWAQTGSGAPSQAPAPVLNSALDDRLMYQLLVAEMALAQGDTGTAYEWLLDAARRTRDEGLFRRSTDVALQARAGVQALAATRAWRLALPESLDALRTQLQILLILQRNDGLAEPLQLLLAQTPAAERPSLIAALPRFLHRAGEPKRVATLMEDALRPYRAAPATRVAASVALGRAWLDAQDTARAWALADEASAAAKGSAAGPGAAGVAGAAGAALLMLELMPSHPQAEARALAYLAQPDSEPAVRLAYVQVLTKTQRYAEAVQQLQTATRLQPLLAGPHLTLGALQLEMKQPAAAQAALLRFLELNSESPGAQAVPPRDKTESADAEAESDSDAAQGDRPREQAWLMLAQAAEQLGDFKAAEDWLARVEDPGSALEVQTRRATLLLRQGRMDLAREAIRLLPEKQPAQARAKLLAEVSLLREAKNWSEAYQLLGSTQQRFGQDADLLYEQAMMAEKTDRLDEMESLLRQVMVLKPTSAHAHNALGYSLAERKVRLPEARSLIQRALELSPGDPFITDSLGWVEFRLGNLDEAARLLRQAWAARPDTEIGAHLGEVLWVQGQQDEARRIWREALARDKSNDVLREALTRLRVTL